MSNPSTPSEEPERREHDHQPTHVLRKMPPPAAPESPSEPQRTSNLPSPGDNIFGFRLLGELGHGAFARVFLAEQGQLAARPVVLKVSDLFGDEPQTLAQLQHSHIVPIYSVHEDAALGLRAVCMPFFGGASLSLILKHLFASVARPQQGTQFLNALEAVQAGRSFLPKPPPAAPAAEPRALHILAGLDYIRAGVWLTARLAEALAHSHQRGVLHRDVKPSNILIAGDGEPMLLDFNVSRNANSAEAAAILGGTVAYSSPEHIRALLTRNPILCNLVDQRSDVYSLGLVLYETIAGGHPFAERGSYSPLPTRMEVMLEERSHKTPSLRQARPDVPWGLDNILRKCLDPDPMNRYHQAEDLAEDLRRFLDDRPLRYAPEGSWVERGKKWTRRHPRLTVAMWVALGASVLLSGTGLALAATTEQLSTTQEQLDLAQDAERVRLHELDTTRALCLVNTVSDHPRHLDTGLDVCEQTLGHYQVLQREDWQDAPAWQRLTPKQQLVLAERTHELLLSLAWAKVRLAPKDSASPRAALRLLEIAEGVRGLEPSRALLEDRASYLDMLGEKHSAALTRLAAQKHQPRTSRDHYLLAISRSRQGNYAAAINDLDRALEMNPGHFWSLMQRGFCYHEQGKFSLAAGDFGVCIGLWPTFAWGYFHRAYSLEKCGEIAEAVRDYTAALARDPGLWTAYRNRGMLHLNMERYQSALQDFEKSLELGPDDTVGHAGRAAALERLGRFAEADAAFAKARDREAFATPEVQTRLRLLYGFAVHSRLPEESRKAFQDVLRKQPTNPEAHYGLALLSTTEGNLNAALAAFNQALAANPEFLTARRYRAVVLARLGKLEQAREDISRCVERDPSGANWYSAACVGALMTAKVEDKGIAREAREQALKYLKRALDRGYGWKQAATDPDLVAIQHDPEFRKLLQLERKQ